MREPWAVWRASCRRPWPTRSWRAPRASRLRRRDRAHAIGDGRRLPDSEGALRPIGHPCMLRIPNTLRGLIAARLDALEAEYRSLVEDAAVLGQSFTSESLAAISGLDSDVVEARRARLICREVVAFDEDPRSPERGQAAFVEGLLREVAYGTLARPDRRSRHLAAVRYFEFDRGRRDHADRGRRLPPRSRFDAERAKADARRHRRGAAARRRRARSRVDATVDAVRFFEQALALTSDPCEMAELTYAPEMRPEQASIPRWPRTSEGRGRRRPVHGDRPSMARDRRSWTSRNDRFAVAEAKSVLEAGSHEVGDPDDDPGSRRCSRNWLGSTCSSTIRPRGYRWSTGAGDGRAARAIPVIADAIVTKGNFFETSGCARRSPSNRARPRWRERTGSVTIQLRALTNLSVDCGVRIRATRGRQSRRRSRCHERHGDEDRLLEAPSPGSVEFSIAMGRWDESLAFIDEHDRPGLRRTCASASRRRVSMSLRIAVRPRRPRRSSMNSSHYAPRSAVPKTWAPYLDRAVIEFAAVSMARPPRRHSPRPTQRRPPAVERWFAAGPTFASGDLETARRIAAVAEGSLDRGRYFHSIRRCIRGGLAMLEGDIEGGVRELREATHYMRASDVRLDLALGLLAIVELAPPDHAARAEAAAEGRDHRRGSVPEPSATCSMQPRRLALPATSEVRMPPS